MRESKETLKSHSTENNNIPNILLSEAGMTLRIMKRGKSSEGDREKVERGTL